jgi:hypothetical protein
MKALGILLGVVGAIVVLAGFGMDGSVENGLSGRVLNIGLLNQKLMLVMVGGAAFVGGVVLIAASEIVSSLAAGITNPAIPSSGRLETRAAGHSLAPPIDPKAAPEDRKRTGYGYCMNCAAVRSYDDPKCAGCSSTGPVIGDAPSPPMTTAPGSRG